MQASEATARFDHSLPAVYPERSFRQASIKSVHTVLFTHRAVQMALVQEFSYRGPGYPVVTLVMRQETTSNHSSRTVRINKESMRLAVRTQRSLATLATLASAVYRCNAMA